MKRIVDARGLACPEPVVLTHKAIATETQVTVIVDNAVAVENITRLAHSKKFVVQTFQKEDGIYLILQKEGSSVASAEDPFPSRDTAKASDGSLDAPLVILVACDCLGRGPSELGERLMQTFLHTLLETTPRPKTMIFMNTGVKLVAQGSRALEDLSALAEQGIAILVCGTCLNYFELTTKLVVGRVSNMYDIATLLLEAGKVVTL